MLHAVRIRVSAYTASFRVPGFIGHQLTLPVPPLSTIYGLLGAARGHWVGPDDVEWIAYRCEYEARGRDLEAIVTMERKKPKDIPRAVQRNVLEREFLVFPRLTLYLPLHWTEAFLRPRFALLLGRTQDVAYVESIETTELEEVEAGEVQGVLLPSELVLDSQNRISAWLQNLPIACTDEPQRRLLGVRIFGLVDSQGNPSWVRSSDWLIRDVRAGTVLPLYRRTWIAQACGRPSVPPRKP